MKRWERFLYGGLISRFSDDIPDQKVGRRMTDKVTDKMVDEIAGNGHSVKQLVARNYLENKVEHAEIKITQSWHSKIIIAILLGGISGFIGLVYFAIRTMLGG